MGTAADAARYLEGVRDRLRDMTPVLEVVAADVRTLTDDSFAQSASPLGAPWVPLAPMTVGFRDVRADRARSRSAAGALRMENRMRLGRALVFGGSTQQLRGAEARAFRERHLAANPRRPHKPLLDTGRLRASITTRVGATSLAFGTNVVYARAQHFGNPDNRVFGKAPGPIPARPYLPVAQDGRTLIGPTGWWPARIRMIEHWLVTGQVTP